jgi:hypothetical protein
MQGISVSTGEAVVPSRKSAADFSGASSEVLNHNLGLRTQREAANTIQLSKQSRIKLWMELLDQLVKGVWCAYCLVAG